MAKYFFDLHDGDNYVRDDQGSDLPTLEAVQNVAIAILSDMARSIFSEATRKDVVIDVRDCDDRYIYTVNLLLVPRKLN